MQIPDAGHEYCFLIRSDKNPHERSGKSDNKKGYQDRKSHTDQSRCPESFPLPVNLSCAAVLRNKDGKRISEILNREISKCVDFNSSCKCRHRNRSKTVHKTLHQKNAEIHAGLLHTGHTGQAQNIPQYTSVKSTFFRFWNKTAAFCQKIKRYADSGNILCNHRGNRRSLNSPLEHRHKEKVKADIHQRRNTQKYQRYYRISYSPKKTCKKIIERRRYQAGENNEQIRFHVVVYFIRNT